MQIFKIFLLVFILSITVTAQWYLQFQLQSSGIYGISFTGIDTGTVVGTDGTILRTTNGGDIWFLQTSGTTKHLYGVSFADANKGIAVGYGPWQGYGSAVILKTNNGGANWFSQSIPITNLPLRSVSYIDSNVATAVGYMGLILRTTNGGINWTQQASGTYNNLLGVSFTDQNNGTAVGRQGTIVRTTNGGDTWILQTIDTISNNLYDICFTNENIGMAVGFGGKILRTTDGGNTWDSHITGITEVLTGVSFIDFNVGAVVGLKGTILRTTNAGVDWLVQSTGTTDSFWDVFFIDANTGTAIGYDINNFLGVIYRTTNGGVTLIEDKKQKQAEFLLTQNFPNPFNPSTSLQYAIGSRQFVTLKVYDVLGNEIATLVNEEKSAGEYEVQFDGSSLPSGIYFYRLQVGDFSETKKMILLK